MRALERDLPRIGHGGGARLGDGGSKIGQGQHAVECRLGETIDDRMPVGQPLAIGVAIALDHIAVCTMAGAAAGCLSRLRPIMCSQRSTQARSLA